MTDGALVERGGDTAAQGSVARAAEWTLIGRAEELALINAKLEQERGGGVVLVGPAGTGKSRLARELSHVRERAGGRVVWALATASAATIPFGALAHLLAPEALRGDGDRLGAFRATAAALRGDDERPPLVIIDDAHLLDEGSAALTLHLALTRAASMVVCVRAGERAPDAVTALWKDEHLLRVDLQPLSDAQVDEMVRAELCGHVAHRVLRWTRAHSQGIPLYVVELVRGAIAQGALRWRDGLWIFGCAPVAPERLRDLIEQRLAGLSRDEREALELIALGAPLEHELAVSLVGAAALEALEEHDLAALDIVGSSADQRRVVAPAHPLHGEVALALSPLARRRRLAARLADALMDSGERRAGDALRLVRWRDQSGGSVSAAELSRAATAAAQAFDPSLAVEYGRRAHQIEGTLPTALVLARLLMAVGRFAEVEALLAPFEGSGGEQDQAAALQLRTRALEVGRRSTEDALALIDRLANAHRSDGWRRLIRDQRISVSTDAGRLRQAAELMGELLVDPDAGQAEFERNWWGVFALTFTGDAGAGRRFAERLVGTSGAHLRVGRMLVAWAAPRLDAGHGWDEVDAVADRALEGALRRGDDGLAGVCELIRGNLALERGAVQTAETRLLQAIRIFEGRDSMALTTLALAMLSQARALHRDVAGARRALATAEEMLQRRPATWVEETDLARARVRIALAENQPVTAQQIALTAADRTGEVVMRRATLLHEAMRAGTPASQVAPAVAQIAAQGDLELVAACAQHATAAARSDGHALQAAAARFAAIGASLCAAEAAAEAAAAHAADGSTSAAIAAAEHSRRLLGSCEGAWTPRLALADSAVLGLTRRETEIALLAAGGLSSPEIAERLCVSARTVESHLQRVYGKLAINRRQDLRRVLAGHLDADPS